MAVKLFLQRPKDGRLVLEPTAEIWQTDLEQVPAGVEMEWTGVRRRNLGRHRKYYLICSKVAEMLRAHGADWATTEEVDHRFRIATGHSSVIKLPPKLAAMMGTSVGVQPGPLNFQEFDEVGMARFLDRVTAYALSDLLPHVPLSRWRADVMEILEAA